MEFNPSNNVVKLCVQGMGMEEKGKLEEASKLFLQAWNEATYDFEKFISAYYLAGLQQTTSDQLKWLDTTLQVAMKINNDSVNSALPLLYTRIAACHADLNKPEQCLIQAMVDGGYMTPKAFDGCETEDDGYNIVFMDKTTREPLFAIEYGSTI